MTKTKYLLIVISVFIACASVLLLTSPVMARSETVKTIGILYEKPAGGLSSNLLSKEVPVTELGVLISDTTVPLTIYSDVGIKGTLTYTVQPGGENYLMAIAPASVTLIAETNNLININLILETERITSPVQLSISVTFSYLKGGITDTISGMITFLAIPAQMAMYYPFSSGSVTPYQFSDAGNTAYLSENKLLICINRQSNFSQLSFKPEGSAFPANTVYRTPDGVVHVLAKDGYITVSPGSGIYRLLIEFPSAYSGRITAEGKSDANQIVYSEAITPGAYSGTPTLNVVPDASGVIILNGRNSCTFTLIEANGFTDTDPILEPVDAANLYFRIEKLTSGVWSATDEIASELSLAKLGADDVKTANGTYRLSAVAGQTGAGTYRVIITQKLGSIILSEFSFPVFTDYR